MRVTIELPHVLLAGEYAQHFAEGEPYRVSLDVPDQAECSRPLVEVWQEVKRKYGS